MNQRNFEIWCGILNLAVGGMGLGFWLVAEKVPPTAILLLAIGFILVGTGWIFKPAILGFFRKFKRGAGEQEQKPH